MSTRAQIKVVGVGGEELWFYRHSDGYLEGVLPTLSRFLEWRKTGRIRDNVQQACGWLVILGNTENSAGTEPKSELVMGWKVGAYEPCSPVFHGDIEFFYVVDLVKATIVVNAYNDGKLTFLQEIEA